MNNLTNVVVTRSQRAGLNLVTLLSKSCCKHDVPMRASVSFSVLTVSYDMGIKLFIIYLDICKHKGDRASHRENVPRCRSRRCIGR